MVSMFKTCRCSMYYNVNDTYSHVDVHVALLGGMFHFDSLLIVCLTPV